MSKILWFCLSFLFVIYWPFYLMILAWDKCTKSDKSIATEHHNARCTCMSTLARPVYQQALNSQEVCGLYKDCIYSKTKRTLLLTSGIQLVMSNDFPQKDPWSLSVSYIVILQTLWIQDFNLSWIESHLEFIYKWKQRQSFIFFIFSSLRVFWKIFGHTEFELNVF